MLQRERAQLEVGGRVYWGHGSWGERVPSLQPSLQAPLLSPLSCLTLGSVRAQTVYKEGVRAS